MKTVTPIEKIKPKFSFDEERVKQLKQIAPEAFADGKINWETLKESLGENLEEDGAESEHFGLFWPGKKEARKLATMPSKGTLIPMEGEGIDEENTQNIFIEGENLEVLKLLQKSYAGKIKMIYIDPPYNTGNDFVYEDDFTEPVQEYLKRTGQLDEEGKPLTTNTRADGRFHSKWLSMMYPRLRLARNLLRDDGIIFVSIDDNEVHNLRPVMNEIFGEENFVEQVTWKKRYGAGGGTKGFAKLHEYILVYSKTSIENIEAPLSEEQINSYKSRDEKFESRGAYITQPLSTSSKGERGNLMYPIIHNNKEIRPKPGNRWLWSKQKFDESYLKNEIVINENEEGYSVRFKQYLKDENGKIRNGKPLSIKQDVFNQEGTQEVAELFGKKGIFDFPKPVALLKYFFSFIINDKVEKEGIYLDFFAGSATTAHSLLELNKEDEGKRKFILVQLPEILEDNSEAKKQGYKTISEISKDRIRKAAKKIKKENSKSKIDFGFQVFKLANSNYKSWKNYEGKSVADLEKQFDLFSTPLVNGWKPENLLYEILLLEGFPLNSKVELLKEYKKNKVQEVSSDFCEHKLLVCLDKKIENETIVGLKLIVGNIFVCLDNAINDQDKVRLSDKGLIKTI